MTQRSSGAPRAAGWLVPQRDGMFDLADPLAAQTYLVPKELTRPTSAGTE